MHVQGAPDMRRFFFATIHDNDGFEHRRPKIKKKNLTFQKFTTINTGSEVKNQHGQSEMRNIPIYLLSQSGMRFIRLQKQEVQCLVKEVQ
jgi:hypothetical protein